jgi:hypothetical protein
MLGVWDGLKRKAPLLSIRFVTPNAAEPLLHNTSDASLSPAVQSQQPRFTWQAQFNKLPIPDLNLKQVSSNREGISQKIQVEMVTQT